MIDNPGSIFDKIQNNEKEKLLSLFEPARYLQPYALYSIINNRIPDKINFPSKIDRKKLFGKLVDIEEYYASPIVSEHEDFLERDDEVYFTVLFFVSKDTWVYFNPGTTSQKQIEILCSRYGEQKHIELARSLINECAQVTEAKSEILLLEKKSYGLEFNNFEIDKVELEISKNYNDDFLPIHEEIYSSLSSRKKKGIVLLYGKPGTGKTTYLRYLIAQLNKKVIYLNPDNAIDITSPDFIGLIKHYKNTVIVIEDAENIITTRNGNNNSVVSNLLNVSDGLLADFLKIQFICTFNTDISKIDRALLRKGRLIASYEFKELSIQKTEVLFKELGYEDKVKTEMTLADIYCKNDFGYSNESSIGFK